MYYKCNNCGYELDSNIAPGSCPNCMKTSFSQIASIKIEPNEIIAGFKLIKRLGQGGMGEVWLAEQTSMERLVALKILKPEFSSAPNFKNRFINEIKHSAKLEHPNIVTAFDAGQYRGLYYLASSFIKGKQLQQRLNEEKIIKEKEALTIALGISKALAYAWNEFNMLHRDIKPGNIIVDISSVPKLLDMGIAKTITEDNSLTMEGDLVGTPFYISPEQAKSEPLDCRSDIYSLGATLYHITTGVIPFQGTSPMGIIAKHITEALAPPNKINPSLSLSINNLIMKMMAKNKEDRFKSWEDVIGCIENILSGALFSERNVSPQGNEKYKTEFIRHEEDTLSFVEIKRIKEENRTSPDIPAFGSLPESAANGNVSQKEGQSKTKRNMAHASIVVAAVFLITVLIVLLFLCFYQGEWRHAADKILSAIIFSFMSLLQKNFNMASGNISGILELKKVILYSLIPVFLLLSAFLSGALAEKYHKSRPYHFIFGFLLPVIYPLFIFKKGERTTGKIKIHVKTGSKKHDMEQGNNIAKYKYNLFRKIARKEDGTPNGPFKFELMNEAVLDVTKILEVKHNQLSVEIMTESGNLKKLKIPFSSIKTFSKI